MFRDISLTIVPLLVLDAEHTAKVKINCAHTSGDTLSMNLDQVHIPVDKYFLIKFITSLPKDTNKTIMKLTSPKKKLNDKEWKEFIEEKIQLKLLRFVCVDEVHLFVNYGLSFRE